LFEHEDKEQKQKLKEYEKLVQDTRLKHEQQDSEDAENRRSFQHKEQSIMHSVNKLRNKLQELEAQQNAKRNQEGEKAYREYEALYQDILKTEEDSKNAQKDIVEALSDWPELQERFVKEHSMPEPTDGISRIAQAAIAYLEALLADGEELIGATIHDGTPLSEVLALTDQEVLAHGYQGGIDLLQRKRAILLRYV
jgi:seryl-tRNA synthetase